MTQAYTIGPCEDQEVKQKLVLLKVKVKYVGAKNWPCMYEVCYN